MKGRALDKKTRERICERVNALLAEEPIATPGHVRRMTEWSERVGSQVGADLDALIPGALLHDVGVLTDRPRHFLAGRAKAAEILEEVGYPEDKREAVLHVQEAHSRYGGPEPASVEAEVAQAADTIEYLGAIGIVRAAVRGVIDGSFSGEVDDFPAVMRKIIAGTPDSLPGTAQEVAEGRSKYMSGFLERLERELEFEA